MNNMTDINYREAIEKRKSVRSYSNEKISQEKTSKLLEFIRNNLTGIQGTSLNYKLLENQKGKIKAGTYGFISGANDYLIFYCDKNNPDWIDIGYIVEKIILYCTHLNLILTYHQ